MRRPRDKVKYRLRNTGAPGGAEQVLASASATPCDASAPDVSCARACRALDACQIEGYPFGLCMNACLSNLTFFDQEGLAETDAYNACFVTE